jgi:hypothetical protein
MGKGKGFNARVLDGVSHYDFTGISWDLLQVKKFNKTFN